VISFDNPIRLVSELRGARMAVVWVFMIIKHRVSQDYLETVTSYTDKTVSQALAYLREVGMADHTTSGWQLTTSAAQQLPLLLGLGSESQPSLKPGDPGDSPEPGDFQADPIDPPKLIIYPHDPDNTLDIWKGSRNISDPLKSLVVEEVNLNNNHEEINKLTTTSTDSVQDGKIPTHQEIRRVLDAAEDLFDHEILGPPKDYCDLDRLLAWICQAYDLRGNSRGKVLNPAGLVYWAFHQGKDQKPRRKYRDLNNADQYVPESFMRDSGQWIFEEQERQDDG
jgi:hypothetical protein